MLDKKQGVHSDFLILLHLLFYFEVGRRSRVGALEIFRLKTLFFLHFSSFCQLHRAFRSHFCGRSPFLCLLLRVIARSDFLRISGEYDSPLPNTIRFHVGSGIGGLALRCPPSACGRFDPRVRHTLVIRSPFSLSP